MNLSTDYTQDPQQNINLVQILIKRKLIEPFVRIQFFVNFFLFHLGKTLQRKCGMLQP